MFWFYFSTFILWKLSAYYKTIFLLIFLCRNNQLQTLPAEIANLSSLREINICYNRFVLLLPLYFFLIKLVRICFLLYFEIKSLKKISMWSFTSLPNISWVPILFINFWHFQLLCLELCLNIQGKIQRKWFIYLFIIISSC